MLDYWIEGMLKNYTDFNDFNDFSVLTKTIREQNNLTQLELAYKLNVTPGTIHKWEKGIKPRLDFDQVKLILNLL